MLDGDLITLVVGYRDLEAAEEVTKRIAEVPPWAHDTLLDEGTTPGLVAVLCAPTPDMDIGPDSSSVTAPSYEDRAPCASTGTAKQPLLVVQPVDEDAEVALHEHRSRQAVGHRVAG